MLSLTFSPVGTHCSNFSIKTIANFLLALVSLQDFIWNTDQKFFYIRFCLCFIFGSISETKVIKNLDNYCFTYSLPFPITFSLFHFPFTYENTFTVHPPS